MTTAERIILAEDDPIMRELACAKLAEAGYRVTAAEDGAAALALLRRCRLTGVKIINFPLLELEHVDKRRRYQNRPVDPYAVACD